MVDIANLSGEERAKLWSDSLSTIRRWFDAERLHSVDGPTLDDARAAAHELKRLLPTLSQNVKNDVSPTVLRMIELLDMGPPAG